MKLDRHSILFRLWLAFFLLALSIVVFICILQVGLIRPYYRNTKIKSVQTVAENIQHDLIDDGDSFGVNSALQEAVDNNACVVIYNEQGETIYSVDSLGAGCILQSDQQLPNSIQTPINVVASLNRELEYSSNLNNEITGQEMVIYGTKIAANLCNYYLLVNSPLEPIDSVVSFFMRQYLLYMLIALIVASFLAAYFSRSLMKPIINMKYEAKKLGDSDYTAEFNGGEFTETKELANTLNHSNALLQRIEEMRRDLMANVSHDIRTPLTNIRAYAEMIRDVSGENEALRNKHLNVIIRETEYMNHLVNDMSELSKMQSGNYVLHKENIDLSVKIKEIVEMDEPLIERGKLHLKLEIPDSLTIYADETKIAQVVANYLSNAIKHTPENKNITIRAYILDDEETVHFEVEDEGEGISEEDIGTIWDRYQKTSGSFSRSLTNTGLGLAIVKAIAKAHHGECGVNSTLGKGSTFWFELKETHEA